MVKIVLCKQQQIGTKLLSDAAVNLYKDLSGKKKFPKDHSTLDRTDPILVEVVEKLGRNASCVMQHLIVKELPEEFECNPYRLEYSYTFMEEIAIIDVDPEDLADTEFAVKDILIPLKGGGFAELNLELLTSRLS